METVNEQSANRKRRPPPGTPSRRPNRAYSRILSSGAGGTLNGNTREGRFVRGIERDLLFQLDGEPSTAQKLLVRRVSKMMLLAERLDDKLTNGETWTPHDARTFGAMNNAIRLALRELGIRPRPQAKPATVADIAERYRKADPH